MLPLIFIVVVSIRMFKTARQKGRNPYLWTGLGVAVFYGIQIAISFAAGIFIFFAAGEEGFDSTFNGLLFVISIGGLIASGAAVLGILWYVNRIPADVMPQGPPQPSFFGLDE